MFRMIQDLIQLFVYYELASRVLASMFANTAKGKWQRQLLWLEALPKVVDRIKNSAYIQLCPTSRQTRQPLTLCGNFYYLHTKRGRTSCTSYYLVVYMYYERRSIYLMRFFDRQATTGSLLHSWCAPPSCWILFLSIISQLGDWWNRSWPPTGSVGVMVHSGNVSPEWVCLGIVLRVGVGLEEKKKKQMYRRETLDRCAARIRLTFFLLLVSQDGCPSQTWTADPLINSQML